MYYKYNIGDNIKAARQARGLTQDQLAEMLDISTHHLSSVERGEHMLHINKLIQLMNTLGCSANQIFKDAVTADPQTEISYLSAQLSSLPFDEQQRILSVIRVLIETSPSYKKA